MSYIGFVMKTVSIIFKTHILSISLTFTDTCMICRNKAYLKKTNESFVLLIISNQYKKIKNGDENFD